MSQQKPSADLLLRGVVVSMNADRDVWWDGYEMVDLEFRYELTLPYTVVVRRVSEAKLARIPYFAVRPVSDTACRGYVVLRVPPSEAAGKAWDEYAAALDRDPGGRARAGPAVVESQRPERLPEDLSAELHFRFDRLAVRYRQGRSRPGIT
jgi:vanillate O-demethylase oxygenase-like protein